MSRLCLLVVTVLALIDCIQIVTSRIINLVVLVISVAVSRLIVLLSSLCCIMYVQSSLPPPGYNNSINLLTVLRVAGYLWPFP